jgi:hypothetical protein
MSRGLNGWQRLWVVVAVMLLVPFVFAVLMELSNKQADTLEVAFYGLLIWASLVGMIYLFGVAVAWVRRGFVSKRT